MDRIGGWVLSIPPLFRRGQQQAAEWQQARAFREEREETRKIETELRAKRAPVKIEPPPAPVVEKSDRAKRETQIPLFHTGDGTGIPPLALLDDPKPQPKGYSEETLETLSRQIEFKLKDFRIDVQVVGAYPGPVITRFELEPAPGVKVSQISSLDKDIARGLSVKAVRVVDVIPGKSVVGLEIPNTHREMIYLSELLRSKEYDKSASPLTIALGKDIGGRPVVADLARMAVEDVGLADPRALQMAIDAWETYDRLGSPEGDLALAQLVIYLASTAKSKAAYMAFNAAKRDVREYGTQEVPLHIRNAPTKLMKELGYGKGYQYDHDAECGIALGQTGFPDAMGERVYYEPVSRGMRNSVVYGCWSSTSTRRSRPSLMHEK